MATGTARRSRDGVGDDGGELRGRVDRSRRDDRLGDAVREALVGIAANHVGQALHVVSVDDVVRTERLVGVHAHVERSVVAVGKATLGEVELRRRHAQVEQRPRDLLDPCTFDLGCE